MHDFLEQYWRFIFIEGLLFILLGTTAIVVPQIFTVAIALFLGWLILLGGLIQMMRTLVFSSIPGFWLWLSLALLQIVLGYLLITNPLTGALTLTLMLLIFFAIEGISKISLALLIKPLANWSWMLFSGVTALIFVVIIIIGWSEVSHWLLGLLLGINMVFLGWALVKMSLHFKPL